MKPERKVLSECALTQLCVCVVLNVELRGNQNSCRVSRSFAAAKCFVVGRVSPAHHALLSVVFVCKTLLCSAAISVRAFDNSASCSLPFSSEQIFLQWKKRRRATLKTCSSLGRKHKSQ